MQVLQLDLDNRDNPERPVPMTMLATDHLPPKDRFDYWREVITERFLPLRPERCGPLPFRASLEVGSIGTLPLTTIRVQGQRVSRPGLTAAEDSVVFLNLQALGTMRYDQAGERDSRPGDGFLIDSSQPFELRCPTQMNHICVTIPKERLLDASRAPFAGRPLSRTRAADALCLDYLQALATPPAALPGSASVREQRLVRLLGYALSRDGGPESLPRDAIAAALYARALVLIDRESDCPRMSPAAMARRLGLSLRTLQRLFARHGRTPVRALLESRVDKAAQRLIDPAFRSMSVTEIAYRSGFADLSYFCRTFQRHTGMTPRRFRTSASKR
jgi:AraC family transcriptional activator of tynA and feaB